MNDTQTIATEEQGSDENSDIDFFKVLIVLAKHKKMIIILPLLTAIAAAAISFALPPAYKSSAKLLPPQQAQPGAAALLAQLGGAAGAVSGGPGIKNPNDLYIGMLRSRTIADKLIARFDLTKVYGTESLERARKMLEERTSVLSGKDNLITVEVEDSDKKRAPQLANTYVVELLNLTKVLAVTEASQRRLFFERQLEMSKNNLANAETALRNALDVHGVISVDSDSRAIVETVGRLRAQIAAKEIQLSAMQAFVTENNQDYKRTQEDLKSLRAEFSRLQNGRPTKVGTLEQPDANNSGLDNIKILREVKYHQMLYELLSKQYEVARLDEAKDTSIIQVLDGAIEPERKFKPKRSLIVLFGAVFGLFAAIGLAFMIDAKEKTLGVPKRAAQWKELKNHLRFR